MKSHHFCAAILLLSTACSAATSNTNNEGLEPVAQTSSPSTSTTPQFTISDVVAQQEGWRMTFPIYDCEVYVAEGYTREVSCDKVGKISFQEPDEQSIAIARQIEALHVYFGSLEGVEQARESQHSGNLPQLTTKGVRLTIYDDRWLQLGYDLQNTIVQDQIVKRENVYQNIPPCDDTKQVVLHYDSCGPYPWDKDTNNQPAVCGPPVLQCGAQLTKGAACNHNGACQSGTCSYPDAVCE